MRPFAVRSPDKRRFLAALHLQPRSEVPYFDPEFAPELAGAILEKPVHVRSYQLPLEPCPGFDIYEAKARWGDRVCLLGGT